MTCKAENSWQPLEESVPKALLLSEIRAWAHRIGVSPKEVHLRPMKRKWGSCSTSGRVTFNEALMVQPADFRRRVIVEELLHLKVPNHGKLFRSLLKAHLADAGRGNSESGDLDHVARESDQHRAARLR